ncbi:sigma-54-dependent transcriptional regulator [Thalassospira xiamenensis]|uniref:sigma-54-dependent transcriptional regulator n=1 Tax=Thalassospira xiamenensis TaxID=220697 RepID=UPI001FFFCA01|nr:sigma 54-interacting transcriptional regulator [Thalassospira xiamenensis]MCK2167789.1 sigma 54-interacting transcriptional regulator [Thalassospira xiamenensis]
MKMLEGINIRDHFVQLCNLMNQTRLDGVMLQGCELVADITHSSASLLYLIDATGGNLVLSAGYAGGFSTWAPRKMVHAIDPANTANCPLSQVAITGRTLCLNHGFGGYDISSISEAMDSVAVPNGMTIIPFRRTDESFLGLMVVLSDGPIEPWLGSGISRLVLKSVASAIETRQIVSRQMSERRDLEQSLIRIEQDRSSLRKNVSASLSRKIVGRSRPMQILRERVAALAAREGLLLIQGDEGVGKEKIARAIHEQSTFSNGPFVYVDCSTLNADVFAPEMFGYKRGAIKGMASPRKGLLSTAAGGMLYLDGVDRLGDTAQTLLLRLLETKYYRPLGSDRDREISARIVASAKTDLASRVQQQQFLPALYYLLRENMIGVPALSECREDIGDIVNTVVVRIQQDEKHTISIDPALHAFLAGRSFPGDRRELEGLIRLAAATVGNDGVLSVAHFKAVEADAVSTQTSSDTMPLPQALASFEQDMISRVLAETDGNRTIAAERLGVPKRTLADKCKKYGL